MGQCGDFWQTNKHLRSPASSIHGPGPGTHPDNTSSLPCLSPLSLKCSGAKIQRSFLWALPPKPKFSPPKPVHFTPRCDDQVGGSPEPPCSLSCLELPGTLHTSGRRWCSKMHQSGPLTCSGVVWNWAQNPESGWAQEETWDRNYIKFDSILLLWVYPFGRVGWGLGKDREINITVNILSIKAVCSWWYIYGLGKSRFIIIYLKKKTCRLWLLQ